MLSVPPPIPHPPVTRRALLRHAGLATAASSVFGIAPALLPRLASAAVAPDAPAPIRLGLASYTFRQFDRAHLIGFLHQLGIRYVNLKDMHLPMSPLDQVAPAAAEFAAAGITITAVGNITFASPDPADIRAQFDYCRAAGAPVMVCAPTRAVLPLLEPFVAEYNIRLAIHNHGPEDKGFPSPFDVLAAVRTMDPRIGACLDVGHAARAGADLVAAIHALGPRLHDVHIKDLADRTSRESQVAVGDGILPIPAIFRALNQIRYPGFVDLEYEIHPDDPLPGVLRSFAYMRGVLAGMALSS